MSASSDAALGPLARAVRAAYAAGEEDEAMLPRVLMDSNGRPQGPIRPGDPVIFYDIRGEREVELSQALTDPRFPHFAAAGPVRLVTMIEYAPGLAERVAFPPEERLQDTLGEVVSRAGLFQLKVVESEKAVHLGYFLSGKREGTFPGEERTVIESLKDVKNYDQRPEMRAAEVADQTIAALQNPRFSLIVTNFANVDVVGHIENQPAVLQAVAVVDRELGRVIEAAQAAGVSVLLTADHGTVEQWLYPEGAVDTGHTKNPVPCLLLDPELEKQGLKLRAGGSLADVAPTVLELLALPKPAAMTGTSLIRRGGFETRPNSASRRRVLLLIADGWGHREEAYGNLILEADTPVMDRLRREHPFTTLLAAGEAVGLPPGTVGNSEAGHLHLGAGRVIYSDRLRIDRALKDDSYFQNPAFLHAMQIAKKENRPLHLLGIVSFFSSHGSLDHLFALMQMAKAQGVKKMFIHSLLGRRGERPEAGSHYIAKVEAECEKLGVGEVVTVMGRFWALDREQNWDRVEKAFRALVDGAGVAISDN
jgi:2,3-bisphosphoglycerate-independent phosphoglycerate mutase